MKIFRFLLVLCLPAFLLTPIPSYTVEQKTFLENGQELFIPRDEKGLINPFGYFKPENIGAHLSGYIDHYFRFLEHINEEEYLETLSELEIDRLYDFVTWVVINCVPQSMPELKEQYEKDAEELLQTLQEYEDEPSVSIYRGGISYFAPQYSFDEQEIFLCKGHKKGGFINQIKRKSKHLAHWVSKHRKPLIAGATVVGVGAIAYLTGGVGDSVASAVGGALINASVNEPPPKRVNKAGEVFVDDRGHFPPPQNFSPQENPSFSHPSFSSQIENEPMLQEQTHPIILEQVENVRREIVESSQEMTAGSEMSILEKAKEVSKIGISKIVHDVYESISNIGTTWQVFFSNSTPEDRKAYKEYVASQHAKIDEMFGTLYPDYSIDSQEYEEAFKAAIIEEFGQFPEMQIGELPPPGAFFSSVSRATSVASKVLGVVGRSATTIGSVAAISSGINWDAPIPITQVNDTIGWKVGDLITNRTINGNVPTWSTVRYRYWKNEALRYRNGEILIGKAYKPTEENIKRMEKGLAPLWFNPVSGKMESIELHHEPPQREGGLFDFIEVTPGEHAKIDPHRHTGES